MKNRIVVILGVMLLVGAACVGADASTTGVLTESPESEGALPNPLPSEMPGIAMESGNELVGVGQNTLQDSGNTTQEEPTEPTVPAENTVWEDESVPVKEGAEDPPIMFVFYTIVDGQYLFSCSGDAEIIDNGDTWDVISSQIVSRGIDKSKVAYEVYQGQEVEPQYDEDGIELPIYMTDLNFQSPTGIDLPHSQHIAKLKSVNPALAKPATVVRRFMGVNYDVRCLVSQSAVDMWLAGTLQIGDFVIVSFIDEIPNETERYVAIVVDKVYESW